MIISSLIEYLNDGILFINFICHLTIFIGGFYVALHSRVMPTWAITGLWYIGISSFLALLTIMFEWFNGPAFDFSYTSLGRVTDTFLHLNIAIMVFMMFFHTMYKDFKNMKNRHSETNIENKI